MMMNQVQAKEFASRWLPAWTGNKPEKLASYYSDDCFYLDAGIPNGANGKAELTAYFRKLLAQNPEWIWSQKAHKLNRQTVKCFWRISNEKYQLWQVSLRKCSFLH